MKKEKSLIDKESLKAEVQFMERQGLDFTLTLSNYTASIDCEIQALCKGYISKQANPIVFMAYQKILKDITKWSANEPPNILRENCEYYGVSKHIDTGFYEKAYNVDIKSAYASILNKFYFISDETFNFINSIPKADRLACVGMLASRKNNYIYRSGILINSTPTVSPYESYFYFCVNETYKLINYLELMLGDEFIFSWVDGIYFKDEKKAKYVIRDIEQFGLKCTYTEINNFTIKKTNKKINIIFDDPKEEGEKKVFNIPAQGSDFKKHILKELNLL